MSIIHSKTCIKKIENLKESNHKFQLWLKNLSFYDEYYNNFIHFGIL